MTSYRRVAEATRSTSVRASGDWLDRAHGQGLVFSIEPFRAELLAGADILSQWVAVRSSRFLALGS